MTENYFEIGKIVNTQGIKGEVRVFPTTDDPSRFELLKNVFIERDGASRQIEIERVRYNKRLVILKLVGVDDMDAAEKLRGFTVKIPPEMALPLGEDEYYIRDLLGCEVFTAGGERLGVISDVISTGANDVYAVSDEGKKDLLIPAIRQCVKSVDVGGKRVAVELLDGLR